MNGGWHVFIRAVARSSATVLARSLVPARVLDAMIRRDAAMPHGDAERRTDALTADFVHVGILFMHVFGRDNAEVYFLASDIEPAVYRRIIDGRFRKMGRGGDPESDSVLA